MGGRPSKSKDSLEIKTKNSKEILSLTDHFEWKNFHEYVNCYTLLKSFDGYYSNFSVFFKTLLLVLLVC